MGEQTSRVEQIFDEARRLAGDRRAEYLGQACAGDAGLLAQVSSLLRALEEAGTFLSPPTVLPDEVLGNAEVVGAVVGPYRLLQLIGEGGFGSVFMAEQERPVRRRVALKVIKLGMDTRHVVARFEAERQALAMMDHPNIARVFDAGATAAGRPYFVMELVSGEPITAYCDRHALPIRRRLELFLQVCQAVQHAHQKGIIHRDVKPSNVLVRDDGERPVAKVIDFGIAKATQSRLTERTLFTEHRQLIGTPAYMSPEQAGGDADIDTRSDVYSLGVLLYELLTGSTPFNEKTLRAAAYDEIQRMIREVDPPLPSSRLSTATDSLPGVAAARRVEPRRLGTIVRGELDWIAMRALEKARSRRYESAAGLAQDVERHLRGEPVQAAPPGAAYRARKFVRRHRAGVVAAAAVAAALIAGAAGTTAGMIRAVRAQHRETAAKLDAERSASDAEKARAAEAEQRQRAEKISGFITQALQAGDPTKEGDQGMLVVDAMRKAVRKIDAGDLRGLPKAEASLLVTISEILDYNGASAEALPLARRAVGLARKAYPGDDATLAYDVNNLASICDTTGDADGAGKLYLESLEMRRRLFPGDNADVATSLNNYGYFLIGSPGKQGEAESTLREALAMRERLMPGGSAEVANTLNNLAKLYAEVGRLADAEPLLVRSLDLQRRFHESASNPDIALALNNLGTVRLHLGRYADARPLLEEALGLYRAAYRGDHPQLANALNSVGMVYQYLDRPAEAEPLIVQSIEMYRRIYRGDDQFGLVVELLSLASVRYGLGRPREAEPLLREAIDMGRRLFPGGNAMIPRSRLFLARVLQDGGDAAAAEVQARDALAERRKLFPGDNPFVPEAEVYVAAAVSGQVWTATDKHPDPTEIAKLPEAESLVRDALATYGRLPQVDPLQRTFASSVLATVVAQRAATDGHATAETRAAAFAEAERLLSAVPYPAATSRGLPQVQARTYADVAMRAARLYAEWSKFDPSKAALTKAWSERAASFRPPTTQP